MGRIVALDLGEKSLGICISDELNILAIPVENYIFKRFDLNQALERIERLLKEYPEIETILLGYPLRTDGLKSDATRLVEEFNFLLNKLNVKIKLVDETYSTKHAIDMLSETIKNKDKIKSLKDVAAAYILLTDHLSIRNYE